MPNLFLSTFVLTFAELRELQKKKSLSEGPGIELAVEVVHSESSESGHLDENEEIAAGLNHQDTQGEHSIERAEEIATFEPLSTLDPEAPNLLERQVFLEQISEKDNPEAAPQKRAMEQQGRGESAAQGVLPTQC